MKKVATIILMIPYALAGGLFYGMIADKLFKEREPWSTLFMFLGLAVSVCIMTPLCGASHATAIWVYVSTSALYTILRLLFGKGSALEMFYAPHFVAIMILILQPALTQAREKSRHLREGRLNLSMQRTEASRFAQVQFEPQWRLAPAADAGCSVQL